jgi:hypothetical protein
MLHLFQMRIERIETQDLRSVQTAKKITKDAGYATAPCERQEYEV